MKPLDTFARRHLGCSSAEVEEMVAELGHDSLETLIDDVVPEKIRDRQPLNLASPMTESEAIALFTSTATGAIHRKLRNCCARRASRPVRSRMRTPRCCTYR